MRALASPLTRITVAVDDDTARAIAADAAARGLTRPEVLRQALAFDLDARSQAAAALHDAVRARGESARRLAHLMAQPTPVQVRGRGNTRSRS